MKTDISFEAHDKSLAEVLFSHRKFRVPRYQRPYAWTVDQVSELWGDLIASEEPYFLGSFIFNTEHEKGEDYVDIIDGQQRLLTITILAAVLRDVAQGVDPEASKLYQRQDIAVEDRSGKESFRIRPADTLEQYFKKQIQCTGSDITTSTPETVEQKRVRENYIYLHQQVSSEVAASASKDKQLSILNRLRQKVAALIVISVEIAREEDAYEIFETTNARGLELSVGDLLKNLIFKKIPPGENRDFAKDVWLEITSNVESTNTELKKFLRYYWISRYSFITEKRLYREIKNNITNWETLLENLWTDSQLYNQLLQGGESDYSELKNGSKIFDSIYALRLMKTSQCYVFLLSVLRNVDALGVDPTAIIGFVERFTFQYSAVCKQPSNKIEKVYSKYALMVEHAVKQTPKNEIAANVQAAFDGLQSELQKLAPLEQLFIGEFQDLSYKNSEDTRLFLTYVLGKINSYYTNTDETRINFGNVNIEHVLPQRPHKTWNLSVDEIKEYVHKIGNLTLLSTKINAKMQNSSVEKKLPELESSNLAVTKDLVKRLKDSSYKWGEKEIIERQKAYSEIAYTSIWKI